MYFLHFFPYRTRKPLQHPDNATTVIRHIQNKKTPDGKRAWDVEITHNAVPIHRDPHVEFTDPFQASQYGDLFRYYVDDSLREKDETKLDSARAATGDYSAALLEALRLDTFECHAKRRSIYIVEEHDGGYGEDLSLHHIAWELLERLEHWKTNRPELVNVTRIILDKKEERAPVLHSNEPVRILLVIGRSMVKKDVTNMGWKYDERVHAGLIQRSIMQVKKHLADIGYPRKVHLDILRPGTFAELKRYLRAEESNAATLGRKSFDIIHLDMHGEMKRLRRDP
jgi:hypothetical protein